MTAWELATILVAIAALVVVAVLAILVIQLRQVIKNLNEVAREIQSTVEQSSERLDRQANQIENEYQRVDGLINTAEEITSRANFVSELSYSIIAKPIMRLSSFLKGTFRIAKILRGRALRSQLKS
ncbi:MAG: hypothetical protein CL470_01650 [Acidimicrobiaceae bacterium]|nr:hypothetical protein [Acidimicrobiaceae bacterium]